MPRVDWSGPVELPPVGSVRSEHELDDEMRRGWPAIAGLAGYAGRRAAQTRERFDRIFGSGSWRQGWWYRDSVLDRAQALQVYEDAYLAHFRTTPWDLERLCSAAAEVFDNEPSNIESGLDYTVQEAVSTHLQDIAIRRCLVRLDRRPEGDHPYEIRGKRSEGYHLNPGAVCFHDPDAILASDARSWWGAQSIEAFWQHNKVVLVPPDVLRLEPRFLSLAGLWGCLSAEPDTTILVPRGGGRLLRAALARYLRQRASAPHEARVVSSIAGAAGVVLNYRCLVGMALPVPAPPLPARIEWSGIAPADVRGR